MMTPADFAAYYKTISNAALLEIVDNPDGYQAIAWEAAKNELTSRQLSAAAMDEAKETLAEKQLLAQQQKENLKEAGDKIKQAGAAFVEMINPVQQETPTTEKTISALSLAYMLMFLFNVITRFRHMVSYVRDITAFPVYSLSELLPLAVMLVAAILFYKRKTAGWVLLAMLVAFLLPDVLASFAWALTRKPSSTVFDSFLPRPSLATYIIQLFVLIGTLYLLCKAAIREVFNISRQKAGVIIVITAIFGFLLLLGSW